MTAEPIGVTAERRPDNPLCRKVADIGVEEPVETPISQPKYAMHKSATIFRHFHTHTRSCATRMQ